MRSPRATLAMGDDTLLPLDLPAVGRRKVTLALDGVCCHPKLCGVSADVSWSHIVGQFGSKPKVYSVADSNTGHSQIVAFSINFAGDDMPLEGGLRAVASGDLLHPPCLFSAARTKSIGATVYAAKPPEIRPPSPPLRSLHGATQNGSWGD